MNTRDQMPGFTHMLNNSGACLVVTEAELVEVLARRARNDARLAVTASSSAEGEGIRALCGAPPQWPTTPVMRPTEVDEEDVAGILYTSGTTGLSKGAMLTHLGIVHSAMHFDAVMALGETDRSIVSVPLGHVTGAVAIIATLIHVAGCIIIMPAFKAADLLRLAERERMTHTVMVPAQYNLLLAPAGFPCGLRPVELADRRLWRCADAGGHHRPAPRGMAARAAADELLWRDRDDLARHRHAVDRLIAKRPPDSVGLALPCGPSIRIMGPDDREVPRGDIRRDLDRGAMVVPGYWRNPEATAREFTDGYWRSGDVGSMDGEGYVRVFDRLKDVINRGGLQDLHHRGRECAAGPSRCCRGVRPIGKPCPVLGERVHAYIVSPEEGRAPDLKAITAECSRQLFRTTRCRRASP